MVGKEGEAAEELRAEQMLVATGRAPNSDNVGLESTRAKVEKGFVQVDGAMRTAEPHLYAMGDVIGGLLLAHVAAHEGIAAVHAIAGAEAEKVDYLKMPRATYSRPQIASIGRTRPNASATASPIKVGKFPFQAVGKALIGGEYEGFVKVIADAKTDEVLGVHMVGPHVTDLIAEAMTACCWKRPPGRWGRGPPAPDAFRGPRRGGPRRRRQVDQLLGSDDGDQDGQTRRPADVGGETSGCRATTCWRCTG